MNRGSAQRTDQMIRALLDAGMQVDILLLNRSEQNTTSKDLSKRLKDAYPTAGVVVRRHPMFLRRTKNPMSRLKHWLFVLQCRLDELALRHIGVFNQFECPSNFRSAIRHGLSTNKYDVYFSNYLKVTPKFIRHFKGLKVVDLHDIQTHRVRNEVLPSMPKWWRGIYHWLYQARERAVMRIFDRLVAISPVEQRIIKEQFCPERQVDFLPMTLTTQKQAKCAIQRYDLLLVGSNSEANINAAEWFLQNVFPHVVQARQDVRFLIQGAMTRNARVDRHPMVTRYKNDNIFLQGFRADLADVYAEAKLVVCPVQKGTGMKVKVIEALAFRKAIVGTSVAFEGIEATDRVHARVVDDAASFTTAILELLDNPSCSDRLGAAALDLFKEKYHFRRLTQDIQTMILSNAPTST